MFLELSGLVFVLEFVVFVCSAVLHSSVMLFKCCVAWMCFLLFRVALDACDIMFNGFPAKLLVDVPQFM